MRGNGSRAWGGIDTSSSESRGIRGPDQPGKTVGDQGFGMDIEFKDDNDRATGRMSSLQVQVRRLESAHADFDPPAPSCLRLPRCAIRLSSFACGSLSRSGCLDPLLCCLVSCITRLSAKKKLRSHREY